MTMVNIAVYDADASGHVNENDHQNDDDDDDYDDDDDVNMMSCPTMSNDGDVSGDATDDENETGKSGIRQMIPVMTKKKKHVE